MRWHCCGRFNHQHPSTSNRLLTYAEAQIIDVVLKQGGPSGPNTMTLDFLLHRCSWVPCTLNVTACHASCWPLWEHCWQQEQCDTGTLCCAQQQGRQSAGIGCRALCKSQMCCLSTNPNLSAPLSSLNFKPSLTQACHSETTLSCTTREARRKSFTCFTCACAFQTDNNTTGSNGSTVARISA
jgi:hypothetical protein